MSSLLSAEYDGTERRQLNSSKFGIWTEHNQIWLLKLYIYVKHLKKALKRAHSAQLFWEQLILKRPEDHLHSGSQQNHEDSNFTIGILNSRNTSKLH